MSKYFTFFILSLLYDYTSSEVYTAVADLEQLLYTETTLISTIQQFIRKEEEKLVLLRRLSQTYQEQYEEASQDIKSYVENPINAYLLIKRLTTDWSQIENLMTTNFGQNFLSNLSQYDNSLKFPSDEDLNGAVAALTRLQDMYRLNTSSLARGELNGVKYSAELSAADCFELGRQSYNNLDYYHTKLWMTEAYQRVEKETSKSVKQSDILDYLAFATYKLGNLSSALDLTNKLLELLPTHERALDNKHYFEEEILKSDAIKEKKNNDESQNALHNQQVYEQYEQLCRGEIAPLQEIVMNLKCKYIDNSNLFLKIAPFKVEEVYTNPKIVIFHDVIADNEINTIKELAYPRLERATVQNTVTGEIETVNFRISKTGWLKDGEHKHIADVVQRVEDMTGLTMTTAEDLHIGNYGIGGHFQPHFDHIKPKDVFDWSVGNRIATVLFYMSDVAQGGATVFPYIKTAIWPKKGTAAFWYNLHSSGEIHKNALHAACPVLVGSKWVSNKWIRERGQEFRKPCDLTRPAAELIIEESMFDRLID